MKLKSCVIGSLLDMMLVSCNSTNEEAHSDHIKIKEVDTTRSTKMDIPPINTDSVVKILQG